MSELELRTDPTRETLTDTGIYVRAWRTTQDEFSSVCIGELDALSLLVWLRSRGGKNEWAENCVAQLLGHPEPLPSDDVEGPQ